MKRTPRDTPRLRVRPAATSAWTAADVSSIPLVPPPEKFQPPSRFCRLAIHAAARRTERSRAERPEARSARTPNAVMLTRPSKDPLPRRRESRRRTRSTPPVLRGDRPAAASARIVRSMSPVSRTRRAVADR
jgi:hypothetical protein